MIIEFLSSKLQKSLSNEKVMLKAFGQNRTKKLKSRLLVLRSARNLQEIPQIPPDRCHQLRGNLKGHFAVDLDHPYRLIFKPNQPVPYLEDGGIDLKSITAVTIVSVEDYHD